MSGLEKLLDILRNHEMEIQFVYDPDSDPADSCLIGGNEVERLTALVEEKVEARNIRLALPTIHDMDDLDISAAGMHAAAHVTCSLADEGLLDPTGKVIVEKYLVGMPIPEGEPVYFPGIKELRTRKDYEKLHFEAFPTRVHEDHPGHHLITFSLEGRDYYYLGMDGDYLAPIFLRLKQEVIPLVFGDDSELALGTRSSDKMKKIEFYFRRVDHFAKQFFAPNEGMVVMVAGDMDFVDPEGVQVYQRDDKLYVQAVHKDFKNSRYLQARLVKTDKF